jgi:hypothetical protein
LTHSEISEGSNGYVLEIDRKSGCRICRLVLEAVFRFLSKYQYQLTIDTPTQHEHARRGGFCPLHTWQYEGISSPYGVCTAYPQLARRFAQMLNEFAEVASHPDALTRDFAALLPTAATCRVCEARIEAERQAVEEVAQTVRSADAAHVPACCLPHLRMVTKSVGGGKPAAVLLRAHADLLERTAEDLQRYAIKYDALRRHLTSEEERRASQLALLLISGHRNVSSPLTIEYVL